MNHLASPVRDTATLTVARSIIREARAKLYALPQTDPTIRCLGTDLAAMAHDLTVEIDAEQPALEIG